MRRYLYALRTVVPLIVVFVVSVTPLSATAQTSSSSNYRVDQTFFGTGGELDASSANYRSKQTAGELAIGNTASSGYQAFAGFNTTDDPYLEFVVTGTNVNLDYLSPSQASTANAAFSVRAWQAGGYTVRTVANPPTNTGLNAHQLAPMTSPGSSTPGTEQFGINLVANTSPATFGASPVQTNSLAVGQAATNYDTANVFTYNKDDVIAQSASSSSVTTYTVSYLFNISTTTPSGEYRFIHDIVVTAMY